jgi:hypothetical protein
MTLHTALAVAALVASIILFMAHASRALALVALVASGLEVAMAFGYLALHVSGISLQLVFGLLIAIPAVLMWLRVSGKTAVSAASILALVGAIQVLLPLIR